MRMLLSHVWYIPFPMGSITCLTKPSTLPTAQLGLAYSAVETIGASKESYSPINQVDSSPIF